MTINELILNLKLKKLILERRSYNLHLEGGPRTQRSLSMAVNTLLASRAKTIYTDGLLHYKGLINKGMHRLERYGTNKIERFNLNLRTYLKRLSRRTIAYSKNMDMLYSCLTIYLWG
ncbi:IS1 family transposase [Ekhidna sp.]|uniref:IS1 family transposase n=1 Tax=Ekhidna sp. TaxID=2608089 RepID=UPI00329A7E51